MTTYSPQHESLPYNKVPEEAETTQDLSGFRCQVKGLGRQRLLAVIHMVGTGNNIICPVATSIVSHMAFYYVYLEQK